MAQRAYAHIDGTRYLLADSQVEHGVAQIRETLQRMVTGGDSEPVVLEVVSDERSGSTAPLFIAPQRVTTVMLEVVEDQGRFGGYV